MIPLPLALLGGALLILAFGGVLWFMAAVLVDVIDWIAAGIERAWRKAAGK